MAVASIIMGALGSAIIVAARAIPAGRTPSMEILAATRAVAASARAASSAWVQ